MQITVAVFVLKHNSVFNAIIFNYKQIFLQSMQRTSSIRKNDRGGRSHEETIMKHCTVREGGKRSVRFTSRIAK